MRVARAGAILFAALLSVGLLDCKDGKDEGCKSDKDCKGSRVCENGACMAPTAHAQLSGPARGALGPAVDAPAPASPPPRSSAACMMCSTQEDFDAALSNGRKCCPVTACGADSECPSGRVCCRIPDGQLCADASRCARGDRVQRPDTTSFACGTRRCRAGQLCCPVSSRCTTGGCVDEADLGAGEDPDYAPFSKTTQGYACNPRTNSPCAVGETCRVGKVGRSPLTMTASCQK